MVGAAATTARAEGKNRMKVWLPAKAWKAKGPKSVSAKIRQRKSKAVKVAKGQKR